MNGIENDIRRAPKPFFDFDNYKRKTVGYPSPMRYDGSVGDCLTDICELFANLLASVYNVDACDSDTFDIANYKMKMVGYPSSMQ
jgi:hypothetical protein